jgi:DNA-binding NarL/FixJ family response regulator
MIKVVIIDDDPLVSTSLKTILETSQEIQVTGIGHCASDAIALYEAKRPDILLTDIRMPDQTGLDAARSILATDSTAIILLLTTFDDDAYIREALALGVKGYLIKQNLSAIVPSIKAAYNGQAVFGAEIVTKLPNLLKTAEPNQEVQFSEREQMILMAVASGKNNKEIAQELFLSEGTVRNYISQLLEKLDLRDRTQLAIYYFQHFN